MKIYMTRHGETEWNIEGRLQGQLNSDLTELGIKQAQWLGKRLENVDFDVICSSPSGRTVQTTNQIKGERPIPVEYYDDLKEIYLGPWEGEKHQVIEKEYPEAFQHFWHEPHLFEAEGQEDFKAIIERGKKVLHEIIDKHEGETVLIVSHAILLKGILAYVKGYTVKEFWDGAFMKATNLSILEVENKIISILLEGDISHYEEL